jgi:hypothetical protein
MELVIPATGEIIHVALSKALLLFGSLRMNGTLATYESIQFGKQNGD